MKKLFFAMLFLGALSVKSVDAQIKVSLNINVDTQPDWGPTGYDHVDYYYLPDIDCYYDVPNHQYVYQNGNSWTRSASLPAKYRNYDLYKSYKVVVNQPKPYLNDKTFRTKYANYKGHSGQAVIRDSHDDKYKNARNKGHQQPAKQQGHDDHGKDKGGDRNKGGERH